MGRPPRCGSYIRGSRPRTGWFFSVRKSMRASQSSQIVSSAIISVKLSMPYSSLAVRFRRSATSSFSSYGIQTIRSMPPSAAMNFFEEMK